jgi:hypothetical protein
MKQAHLLSGATLQINGKAGLWTPGIFAEFETHVGPRMRDGESISQANYYEPRPYNNEWDRGDPHFGFTYTVQPGNRVAYVQWRLTL